MDRGYVLHAPRSLAQPVAAGGLCALGVVGYAVARMWFDVELDSPFVFFCLLTGGYGVVRGLRRPEVLRLDGEGVRFGEVVVPWPSVWHVVLLRPEPVTGAFRTDLPPQVGLRLKRGAPLPEGVDALVSDPNDPLAIPASLRSDVARPEIDGDALLAAADRCAPADVVLVERVGDREHVRPR